VTSINTVYENEAQFPSVAFCSFQRNRFSENSCFYDDQPCQKESLKSRKSNCEIFNTNKDEYFNPIDVLNSQIPGINHGLRLVLFPKQGTQISIFIHNQSTVLDLNKKISVSKGMEFNLVVKRVFSSKLSSPFSNCQMGYSFKPDKNDIKNQTYFPYFQSQCFVLCRFQKEMEICNRTEAFSTNFRYFFTNKYHFHYNFYNPEKENCTKQNLELINSIEREFDTVGQNKICEKMCPIECNSVSYSITPYINALATDYSLINVYYEDFYYTKISESEKTSFDSLVGTIGGLLGLFLGASLISFYEIFDLALNLFLISIHHLNKFKPRVNVS